VLVLLSLKGVPVQEVHVDLNNIAQWHLDLNGGLVPILEIPHGDQIVESGVNIDFANEYTTDKSVTIYPTDPVAAAKMRVIMSKFNLNGIWGAMGTRYKDETKYDAYREQLA